MPGLTKFFFRDKPGRFFICFLFGMVLSVLVLDLVLTQIGQPSYVDYQPALPYLKGEHIGFWADVDTEEALAVESAYAQFWLAPVLLNYSDPTCCEQLLVSLINQTDLPAFPGYTLQHETGTGLFLLERG